MSEDHPDFRARAGLLVGSGDLAGPRALAAALDAEVEGDLDGCRAAFAGGVPVAVYNPGGYVVDRFVGAEFVERGGDTGWNVVISDFAGQVDQQRTVRLVPRGLVVGIGTSSGVSADTVLTALSTLDSSHGACPRAIRAVSTVDRRAREPGLRAALREYSRARDLEGVPQLCAYASEVLSGVTVASPSRAAWNALGTASVAEAAALRAASELGDGRVHLVLPKRVTSGVTLALARVLAPVHR